MHVFNESKGYVQNLTRAVATHVGSSRLTIESSKVAASSVEHRRHRQELHQWRKYLIVTTPNQISRKYRGFVILEDEGEAISINEK